MSTTTHEIFQTVRNVVNALLLEYHNEDTIPQYILADDHEFMQCLNTLEQESFSGALLEEVEHRHPENIWPEIIRGRFLQHTHTWN